MSNSKDVVRQVYGRGSIEFPDWLDDIMGLTIGIKFREIAVTTDFDIHLHHAAGYEPK